MNSVNGSSFSATPVRLWQAAILTAAAAVPADRRPLFDLRHGRTATHAVAIDSGSAPPAPAAGH